MALKAIRIIKDSYPGFRILDLFDAKDGRFQVLEYIRGINEYVKYR